MAVTLQFLCVLVPLRNIQKLRGQGAFSAPHPLLEHPGAAQPAAGGDIDWLAEPDPAEIRLRFSQRWSRRAFRPGGGYFVGGLGTEWYDDHLYCNTFMNPLDADSEIEAWMACGLTPFVETAGSRIWQDLCVAASRRGPKFPCPWLEYDIERNCAWLRGHPAGAPLGGNDPYEAWTAQLRGELADSDF